MIKATHLSKPSDREKKVNYIVLLIMASSINKTRANAIILELLSKGKTE